MIDSHIDAADWHVHEWYAELARFAATSTPDWLAESAVAFVYVNRPA